MGEHTSAISLPSTGSAHLVQLFDSDESLADGVARFLHEGLVRNEQMLAVMNEERWYGVAMRLSRLGSSADEALQRGDLIVRSAKDTLSAFMYHGRPHPQLFAETVGDLVSALANAGRPLRIYGEMVDVLAAQGDYAIALELEQLWNQLAEQHRFTLFCGYSATHFGDPRNAGDLRRICQAHTGVRAHPHDVLGSFLVNQHDAA